LVALPPNQAADDIARPRRTILARSDASRFVTTSSEDGRKAFAKLEELHARKKPTPAAITLSDFQDMILEIDEQILKLELRKLRIETAKEEYFELLKRGSMKAAEAVAIPGTVRGSKDAINVAGLFRDALAQMNGEPFSRETLKNAMIAMNPEQAATIRKRFQSAVDNARTQRLVFRVGCGLLTKKHPDGLDTPRSLVAESGLRQ